MNLVEKNGLLAPKEYWEISEAEKEKLLNKCGGALVTAAIVPNHILGKNVEIACNVHDFMYINGKTLEDKEIADNIFNENLQTLVDQTSNPILKNLRRFVAKIYSAVASVFGHFYF